MAADCLARDFPRRPRMRSVPFLAALLIAAPLLAATTARAEDKLNIVAAENFYGDLAPQIGGSHVAVTSILSNPDDDPHLFEIERLDGPRHRRRRDRHLQRRRLRPVDGQAAVRLDATPSARSSSPPTSPATRAATIRISGTTRRRFPTWPRRSPRCRSKRDPANADGLQRPICSKFIASLRRIDSRRSPTSRRSYAGTAVTATEPVFGYMAEALGLKMLNDDFQIAMMNDTEPSPSGGRRVRGSAEGRLGQNPVLQQPGHRRHDDAAAGARQGRARCRSSASPRPSRRARRSRPGSPARSPPSQQALAGRTL